MDPDTHNDASSSDPGRDTTSARTNDNPWLAHDYALLYLCVNVPTGSRNQFSTPIANTNVPQEDQNRDHVQDRAARSLYTRLISMFQHKDRPNAPFPTPPASPRICNFHAPPSSSSPSLDQPQIVLTSEALCLASLENAPLLSWTPLTPDSLDHHSGHKAETDVWPKLDSFSPEIACSVHSGDQQYRVFPSGKTDVQMKLSVENKGANNPGLAASLHLSYCRDSSGLVTHPNHEKDDEDLRPAEGIQLGQHEDLLGRSGPKNNQWGKSRASPIV